MVLAAQASLTLSSSDPGPCGASAFSRPAPVSEEPDVCALPPPPATQGDMKNDRSISSGPTEEEHEAGSSNVSGPD